MRTYSFRAFLSGKDREPARNGLAGIGLRAYASAVGLQYDVCMLPRTASVACTGAMGLMSSARAGVGISVTA